MERTEQAAERAVASTEACGKEEKRVRERQRERGGTARLIIEDNHKKHTTTKPGIACGLRISRLTEKVQCALGPVSHSNCTALGVISGLSGPRSTT